MSSAPSVSTLVIRTLLDRDLPDVVGLERAIYPQPWSQAIFESELKQQGRVYRVATLDGRIVGYGGLMVIADDAHITTLAVDPTARRHHLGTKLMMALVDEGLRQGARHLTLEVRMSNTGAQRLYSKFGLAPVGVRKDYYLDEDALIMWATDIDAPDYQERLDRIRERLDDG